MQAFEKVAGNSNVEEFLTGIYIPFDYSWKQTIFLLSFERFCSLLAWHVNMHSYKELWNLFHM